MRIVKVNAKTQEIEEILYFRKAFHLHNWFIKNLEIIDEQEEAIKLGITDINILSLFKYGDRIDIIPTEKIKDIVNICDNILKNKKEEICKAMLPIPDYIEKSNEWYSYYNEAYFDALQLVVKIFGREISNGMEGYYYEYKAG